GRRAHVAGHAARRAVLARGEDVTPAETLRVDALDLGIRDRRQLFEIEQIAEQVPDGDDHAADDRRQIKTVQHRQRRPLDPYDTWSDTCDVHRLVVQLSCNDVERSEGGDGVGNR